MLSTLTLILSEYHFVSYSPFSLASTVSHSFIAASVNVTSCSFTVRHVDRSWLTLYLPHGTLQLMLRPPYHRWRVARLTAASSIRSVGHCSTAHGSLPSHRAGEFSRRFTQFNVAAVRLLSLTLLDHPTPTAALTHSTHPTSIQSSNGALVASSSHQRSIDSAQFIPPAVLDDTQAWERWLDGIDGEQTFIVSRTLLPQLFQRLNTGEQPTDTTATALHIASDFAAAPQQLTHTAADNPTPASTAPTGPTAGSSSSLGLLHQRLLHVQSLPLTTLAAPQRQRTKQQRASTAIPPAPSVQPPLTQQQKALFDAIPQGDLSSIATQYSASVMPVDQRHPSHGGTMLHIAAMHNRADVVHWLLTEQHADPDSRAFNHSTPLHWAAGNDATATLRILLSHGANPTLTSMTHHSTTVGKGSGQTALHWAAESGHVDSVRLLTQWAPQLVTAEDERGRAAKDVAEAEGRSEVVRLVRQLESEEYVGVKVQLAYRGQRIIGAQRRQAKDSTQ